MLRLKNLKEIDMNHTIGTEDEVAIYYEDFVEKMSDEYDPYGYIDDEEQDIKFYDYSLIEFDWVSDD
tara:strand:- start:262 stop:462 length:201 start_codon:yes stop_codon:yes gene_type:complete